MITLKFDNFNQLKIFFLLLNNPKGLGYNEICKRLCLPRTTMYDILYKLMNKKTLIPYGKREIKVNLHYVKKFRKQTNNRGRPKTIFFIAQLLREQFFKIEIPNIYINNELISSELI